MRTISRTKGSFSTGTRSAASKLNSNRLYAEYDKDNRRGKVICLDFDESEDLYLIIDQSSPYTLKTVAKPLEYVECDAFYLKYSKPALGLFSHYHCGEMRFNTVYPLAKLTNKGEIARLRHEFIPKSYFIDQQADCDDFVSLAAKDTSVTTRYIVKRVDDVHRGRLLYQRR